MLMGRLLIVCTVLFSFLSPTTSYLTFSEFIDKYERNYNQTQYALREQIYNKRIVSFADIVNFIPNVNNFTDWTDEEISELSQKQVLPQEKRVSGPSLSSVYSQKRLGSPASPEYLDHRLSNIISPVRSQGSCSTGWAFAVAGLVESYLIKNKNYSKYIDLSEQQIIECIYASCYQGGFIEFAFDLVSKQIFLQSEYPYKMPNTYGNTNGICDRKDGIKTNIKRMSYYNS